MKDREKLIELIKTLESHPEKTCPRLHKAGGCEGCTYAKGTSCDILARKADYLLENGVRLQTSE